MIRPLLAAAAALAVLATGAAAQPTPPPDVQLRADRKVPYGEVAELIALLQQAGLTRIGFVIEPVK
jgi:biopolymer transport protein ExbD/biopolymer transport protein TolR